MAERGVVAVEGGSTLRVGRQCARALRGGVRRRARRRAAASHPGLIDAMVDELAAEEDAAGVIAATPVTDTIEEVGDEGRIERTLDRSGLWAVQTPQAFRADALRDALADPDSLPAPATTRCWSSGGAGGSWSTLRRRTTSR